MRFNFQYHILCASLICLLTFGSCKKYLSKKSNDTLITPSSLSDMQSLLDDAGTMNQARTPSYGEASSDEYFLNDADFNSVGVAFQSIYTWAYYPLNFGNDWSSSYQPIYNANLVLDLLKNVSPTESNKEEWNNVKGSALFYRSYYFLQLLWDFAKSYDSSTAEDDLGIVLRLTSDFNAPSVRSTNEQCYQQIINDIKFALPLLPSYAEVSTRPSKEAAYALLARCYLSMRNYKNALLYSDSSLQLNSQLIDYNGDEDINTDLSVDAPFKLFNKETIFYTEMNTYYYIYITSIIGGIDSSIIKSYDSSDLRKTAYFKIGANSNAYFKGSYTASNYSMFSGIATDEMYLIRAECYIRLNQLDKGWNDINTLLKYRYKSAKFTPLYISSQINALNFILQERKKELIMRGLRWMDIKRLNKEGANIVLKRVENNTVYTLQANANFYALPLPADIVQQTGIPQNE